MTGAITSRDVLVAAARGGELDTVADRLGIRLLGIFGSAARGDGPARDLDVCVSFSGPARELDLLDELSRLTGDDRIDLLVLDGAEPLARARAMVGVGLHEAEPGGWATAQMAALAEARDTAHLRDLDRRALTR